MPHPYARKERTQARDLIAWGLDIPVLRNILRKAISPQLPIFQRLVGWGRPEPRLIQSLENSFFQPADSVPGLRDRDGESTDIEDAANSSSSSIQYSLIPPLRTGSDRNTAQAHMVELAHGARFGRRLSGRRERMNEMRDWGEDRQQRMCLDVTVQQKLVDVRRQKLEIEKAEEADDEGASAEGEEEVAVERELARAQQLAADSIDQFFEASAWSSTDGLAVEEEEEQSTDSRQSSFDSILLSPTVFSSGPSDKFIKNLWVKQGVALEAIGDRTAEEANTQAHGTFEGACTARNCSSCMWKNLMAADHAV